MSQLWRSLINVPTYNLALRGLLQDVEVQLRARAWYSDFGTNPPFCVSFVLGGASHCLDLQFVCVVEFCFVFCSVPSFRQGGFVAASASVADVLNQELMGERMLAGPPLWCVAHWSFSFRKWLCKWVWSCTFTVPCKP